MFNTRGQWAAQSCNCADVHLFSALPEGNRGLPAEVLASPPLVDRLWSVWEANAQLCPLSTSDRLIMVPPSNPMDVPAKVLFLTTLSFKAVGVSFSQHLNTVPEEGDVDAHMESNIYKA